MGQYQPRPAAAKPPRAVLPGVCYSSYTARRSRGFIPIVHAKLMNRVLWRARLPAHKLIKVKETTQWAVINSSRYRVWCSAASRLRVFWNAVGDLTLG